MKVRWEAWCYRCRERDGGEETTEALAKERVADFKTTHRDSCGASASVGHLVVADRAQA